MPEWTPAAFFLFLVLFASAVRFYLWRRRRLRMIRFANSIGLDFLGGEIPKDVPEKLYAGMASWTFLRNCVSGRRDGNRVVCFDLYVGSGRSTSRYTAVGVKRPHERSALKFYENKHLIVGQEDDWILGRSTSLGSRLMNPEEITQFWDFVPPSERKEMVPDDATILRPRHFARRQ